MKNVYVLSLASFGGKWKKKNFAHRKGVFCSSKSPLYFWMAGPEAAGFAKHPGIKFSGTW
jgi:hypothetical protein